MNLRSIFAVIGVISLLLSFSTSATEVTYGLEDLGSGQWLYHYTVINNTLGEPIMQFIIWFEPGLYENLSIVSDPEIGYDWYQDTVEPDPVWLFYGAYRALAWGDGIAVGDYQSGFAVSFTYLGEGVPGWQEFDVVDPVEYISLEAGWTVPVYCVDAASAGNPEQNGTLAKPFGTIQAGIDAAVDGYTVRVLPGIYEESIDFFGKEITVQSYEATMDNPAVIVGIDNNAVKFHSGETYNSILEGFVITSSTGRRGITCHTNTAPMIRNNLIVCCGNDDSFESEGTAIQVASGCSPIILFNTITGNYGSKWSEKAVSIDNTDVSFDGIISHCIIYGNSADLLNRSPEFLEPGRIEYCDIGNINDNADWLEGAEVDEYGNFSEYPEFVSAASGPGAYDGDYHLRNGSPCINAGDPCYVPWDGATDFDGQGRIIFDRVDVGADEVAPNTKVTKPAGGEVWAAGSRHEIRWESFAVDNVDIYYSRNNGSTWKPVESNLPHTGSYEWRLPYVDSEQCLVWVAASVEPSDIEYNTSDVFTIRISEPGPPVESAWPTLGADSDRRGLSGQAGPQVGCIKWQFETEASFYKSVAVGANGYVHIASEDGKLYTVDPNTGTAVWIFDANSPVTSSPTVGADGTVYVGCMNGRLYAIDIDGNPRWTYDTGSFIYSTPAIAASSDGEVYFGSQDGKLYALGADGSEVWTFETAGPGQVGGAILTAPVIGQDGSVYIGSVFDSKFYALEPDPNFGAIRWVHDFSDLVDADDFEGLPFASPAIGPDGTIYMLLPNPINLYALSPADGSIIWTADGAEAVQHTMDKHLQGHWEFEGNTLDSSGNGRDGILVGDAILDTEPVRGQVLRLLNGYLWISGYEGITGTVPRTVSAWIKTAVQGEIISWGDEPDGQQWRFQVRDWCSVLVFIGDGLFAFSPDYNLINNEWHHVAVSWDGGGTLDTTSFKFYIDGRQIETRTSGSAVQINTGSRYKVKIGVSSFDNSTFWGKVDDVRIYDRVLTIVEILGKNPDAYCWQRPVIGPEGTIYVNLDDNYLRAFNPDGSVKWVKRAGMTGGLTLAVDKDGFIYAASEDGSLYVMNSSGAQVARLDGGDWLSAPVIGEDGTIYVFDVDNNVLAIDRYGCEGETVDLHWVGDFNSDGAVDFDDVVILAFDWMACGSSTLPLEGDSNRDLYVDLTDFAAVAAKWMDEI